LLASDASVNCTFPEIVQTQLIASENSTANLTYYLISASNLGNSYVNRNTGIFQYQCLSLQGGNETLQWYVYDNVTITIANSK